MAGFRISAFEYVHRWPARARDFSQTRRARRISFALGTFLLLYGVVGFVGVPAALHHVLTAEVAAALKRPVAVGRIQFDPYRLRLEVDKLHVADRDGTSPFVDVSHIYVKASWASLFRLAAVIAEVRVDRPRIHISRSAAQKFNFSDLLQPAHRATASKPAAESSKPFRFAVSNISVRDGDIRFDDQVVGSRHEVANIQIGVPFIASLPRDVDIYVQPLLAMVVDGSPLRIAGQTKPLSATRDTVLTLNLHALDLHRYLGYVPIRVPIRVPRGTFSSLLQVHFVDKEPAPVIAIAGRLALDRLQVNDIADAPIVALGHLVVTFNDVEPLGGIYKIGRIRFDRLAPNVVINADGTTNLTPLIGTAEHEPPAPPPASSAPLTETSPASSQPPSRAPVEVTLDSFRIENSTVGVNDNSGATPAQFELANLHMLMRNLSLNGHWSAPFEISAALASGGQLALKGGVDVADRKANTEVAIDQIDLPALQDFAHHAIAARISGGKLRATGAVSASFATGLGIRVEPASVAISDFALAAPDGGDSPLQWRKFNVQVGQFDLASRTATVREVRGDGIKLSVRRERSGRLNLVTMLQPPLPRAAQGASKSRAAPKHTRRTSRERNVDAPARAAPWNFSVASVVLEGAEVKAADDAAPHPVYLEVSPLNVRLKQVSSDFKKPIDVDLDGKIGRYGRLKAKGSAAIAPLRANIEIAARRVDLSPVDAYLTRDLNAKIASALLSVRGRVLAEQTRAGIRGGYRGDLTLANLRVLDRRTNQDFLRWESFTLSRIDASGGAGEPKAHVGEVALANFDAGVILTADGTLNLKDITSRAGAPSTSAPVAEATLEAQSTPAGSATPAQAAQPAAQSTPARLAADVEIGAIDISGGNIDYSDYFIKPNYSANLTQIVGSVGEFGTASTKPANVDLHGEIYGSAPLSITGSLNPLAPIAFVDLAVRADGVELTSFSPYTTRYTGYPIEKGTLTADVHYLLDRGELRAENHIVIGQLTFGNKVENTTAINLPIRVAVAILKDSNGVIDLNVPISGSLSDPQFSIGAVVLHAFWNVIVKAATSPFSVLGGMLGTKEDLSQITFAPGYALLTQAVEQQLDTVAKELERRSKLKLNIQGCVDPAVDREGLREAMVDLAVRQQKLKATRGSGDPWEVKVAPDEYDKYLHRAYSAADFPKPRNLLGVAKSIPAAEMKKLMLANVSVTDADLSKLADARADAVRKFLAAKIDSSRLFVKPPNVNAGATKDGRDSALALLTLE